MTTLDTTNRQRDWRLRLIAATGTLALAALLGPTSASAKEYKANGVHADLKRGTLTVKGSSHADAIALRLKAGDPGQVQVDVGDDGSADFAFARSRLAAIAVRARKGDDSVRVDDANGAFTDTIPTTLAGGRDDDSLEGGQLVVAAENETFKGGKGDDTVDGGKGTDTAHLGRGDDTFRWDPGEGSDVIEGQDGSDTMLFIGAAGGETVTMTANGGRLTFFRQPGNVTMDTDDVEAVDFIALGGPDNVTVNDLTGTDVVKTNLDLAPVAGGEVGDGIVDNVVVNGTDGDDAIDVLGATSGVDVTGLATAVFVRHPDRDDTLSVNTLAGTDDVSTTGVAGVMQVLVDGAPA